jgi:hypothetical protein
VKIIDGIEFAGTATHLPAHEPKHPAHPSTSTPLRSIPTEGSGLRPKSSL